MKSEKRSIEIEDLLRLKRAERPPAEFWDRFDRELRAKQLSALVAKRPWWQRLNRAFAGLRPTHLSVGATAVLVVAFVSLRQSQTVAPVQTAGASVARLAVDVGALAAADVSSEKVLARETAAPRIAADERVRADASVAADPSAVSLVVAPMEIASSHASVPKSLVAATGSEFVGGEGASGLRHIGAALTVISANEPMAARGLLANATTGFEARALPVRSAVEPLQQITPPGERTRHKLLTAMMTMSVTDTQSRTGEHVAGRLSEERLYDQVSRFGARGAGVSMKF